MPITTRAHLSWAFVLMALIFFTATLLWAILQMPAMIMLDHARNMSNSSAAATGIKRVSLVWRFFPVWGLGTIFLYGLIRATRESNRRGV